MFDDFVPADEEHLLQLRGLPVCVIMNDGARHYGTLTGCTKDKLILNGDLENDSPGEVATKTRTKSRRTNRSSKRVRAASKNGPKEKHTSSVAEENVPPEAPFWATFDEPQPLPRSRVTLPLEPIQAVLIL